MGSYSLTYGHDAVLPMEVVIHFLRVLFPSLDQMICIQIYDVITKGLSSNPQQ